jgi:hypothetical protein
MPSAGFISTDFATQVDPPQPNGCTWYRMVLPSRQLAAIGWETGVGMPRAHPEKGFGVSHEDGAFFGWDVNVFKLMMHESTTAMFKVMQQNGEKVVVDVDDFHFGIHEENIAASKTNPNFNPENNRMFFEMGIRQADTVLVSTQFLADFYSRRCREVRVVRNAVDVERFTRVEQPENPVYGWVGATLWRSGDIEMLSEWLPDFSRDYGVPVHHSGHIPNDSRHFAVRAGLKRVTTTMIASIPDYPKLLNNFHVGLVPLTRNPFNEAKSSLKGLEYAAAGIPFIATPTQEYRLLFEAGVGRLAGTPDEWRDHAAELLDPDVRRFEAEKNWEIVNSEFNIVTKGQEWASALLG